MNSMRKTLLAGTFLYIFLAPFFFHPDIKTIFYLSQFLKDGVFNIYEFLAANPDRVLLGPFVYPPLAYFLFGTLFLPVKILAGSGFVEWLSMGNDAVAVPHIFQYLFSIKLPLILVHTATGFFLVRLLDNPREKIIALTIWFFNPISIYIVAMMGQFDGIPAFLTVVSLVLVSRQPYLSVFILGLAAALKSYPLFLLPFMVLFLGKTWFTRIKFLAIGLSTYLITIIPYLRTPEFYEDALVSNLSQRIFEISLPIGFNERLLIIPGIIVFLFFLSEKQGGRHIFPYFLAIPLVFLAGSHFHPQWTMWALPFLIVGIVRHKLYFPAAIFLVGWVATIALFQDKFLTWGILGPVEPALLFLPAPMELISPSSVLIQSLMHTAMTTASIWILWRVFINKRHE